MPMDNMSPEVAYATKGNVAVPYTTASAAAIAALAQNRMQDAYRGTTITVAASDVIVVAQ